MLTCSKCGEEVRWGRRHDQLAYWHREDKDHFPLFGKLLQPGEWEQIAARHHSRGGHDRDGNEVETAPAELEPVEVPCTPLPLAGKRSVHQVVDDLGETLEVREERVEIAGRTVVIPGGARALVNQVQKADGWELRRFTYARGPFVSAKSQSLGVSDSFVVGFAAPVVDGRRWYGVASWRTPDGGDPQVLFGWRITPARTVDPIGVAALKTWIKEFPDG